MSAVLNIVDSAAIMASVALLYGTVRRNFRLESVQHVVLGAAFGLGAVTSMLQPIQTAGNVIIDARALFTGFAGAFLGLEGALAALFVAVCGRLAINISPAALTGVLGMVISTGAGLGWRHIKPPAGKSWKCLAGLGALVSLSYSTLWMVPELQGAVPVGSIALLTLYNILGSIVLGTFIYREQTLQDREVTALKAAATDPLTGVLNRRGFSSGFVKAETAAQSKGSALLLVDLDHFKAVNDTYGHGTGDLILKLTGERIRRIVRPRDLVQRAGGEEFAVLLTDIDADDAKTTAERILKSLSDPCSLPDQSSISVSASIGGVCWTTGHRSEASVTASADRALYMAKAQGRNRAIFDLHRVA